MAGFTKKQLENLKLEPENLASIKDAVQETFYQDEDFSSFVNIMKVKNDDPIALIGEMEMVGKAGGGCDPTYEEKGIANSQKRWELGQWEIPIKICYEALKGSIAEYSLKTGTAIGDLTSTDFMTIYTDALQRAMQLIEEAIKLRPLPLYVQTQGDLYFGMKDYAKAYECYDRVNHSELRSAESLFSAARTKQVMGANDEALALMDSTVAFFGPLLTEKAAPYVFQRAQMKASIGKYREAVADYNEYERLVLGKANAEFFFIREQAEMQCRLYQQALDDIEKAVEMDPKQVAYIIEQVALYTRFSQFDKAVEAARRGIELAPDNADLYRPCLRRPRHGHRCPLRSGGDHFRPADLL